MGLLLLASFVMLSIHAPNCNPDNGSKKYVWWLDSFLYVAYGPSRSHTSIAPTSALKVWK